MSQISQKSISGITSITTPAGIDNQFTLHTNDTSQAAKLDSAGNFHFSNHVNTTGITSASNFKTGSSNLHSTGLTVGDTFVHSTGVNASSMDIDDFVDVGNNIKLGNAGVITATSFVGDGSDLTNLPAGLGTALSATATSPLNKMYYTNQVLGVPSSITVDVPTSASKAYTQYADIKVESSADLIIAEGDDLIPDVLGLADFGTFGGGASAGRIRVNSISNAANDGSPTVQKGLVVTGVTTSTTFSGSGASLTNLPSAQLTGALPALDGSNLTGLSGVSVANQADNRLITATGTTDALNAEADITYDGTILAIAGGKYINCASPYRIAGHPVLGYDNFTDISGGSYATRLGSTGTSTLRSTQIYGGGSHLATFDGVNSRLGLRTTTPAKDLHVYNPSVATVRIETGDSRGQAWDILSTNGAQNNTGTLSFRDESGSSYVEFGANEGSPQFRVRNGGANDLLHVDSSGRVTKPYQPFVNVHIATTTNRNSTGSQMIIPWDTIHANSTSSNVGNHFNTSTHRFTAPIAGRYLFVVSLNIVGDNIMYHRINGTNRHGGEYRITDNVWDHLDSSFIYDMNANDYYDMTSQLYSSHGQRWNGGGNSGFGWDCLSIYLLG